MYVTFVWFGWDLLAETHTVLISLKGRPHACLHWLVKPQVLQVISESCSRPLAVENMTVQEKVTLKSKLIILKITRTETSINNYCKIEN